MKKKIMLLLSIFAFCYYGTALAEEIPDKNNMKINSDEGDIYFVTDSTCELTGEWMDSDVKGIQESKIKYSVGGNASWSVTTKKTMPYTVYYWMSPDVEGDKNAKVTVFCNAGSSGEVKLDFSECEAGWKNLGVYYPSDSGSLKVILNGSGKGKIYAGAFKVIESDLDSLYFYQDLIKCSGYLLMEVGNNYVYADNSFTYLPAAPCINDSRTLVPIRFVSEMFDGKVDWNEAEKRVDVSCGGKNLQFFIGKNEYYIDGEMKIMDTHAEIINNRTMLPLGVVAESLGKKLQWYKNGIIVIANDMETSVMLDADFGKKAEVFMDKKSSQ